MTVLLYMNGFDIEKCEAEVDSVSETDDGRADVVVDETCFYARGGGQDWDLGTISAGDASFVIEEVRLDETGVVHHIGKFRSGTFSNGDVVQCEVDRERRNVNTRLHSAGHALDLAVERLGYPWIPGKGGHYPHMSFVEYSADPTEQEIKRAQTEIEELTNKLIAAGGENEIRFMPVSEMGTVCRHVPANIPLHKPARVVIYAGDFGVPCGGTHVRDIGLIGEMKVTKIKLKNGVVRVSYAVVGINDK